MISNILKYIIDIIFPPICIICKKQGNHICDKCLSEFKINDTFFCPKCMQPLIMMPHKCNIRFIDIQGIAMIALKSNKNISKLISTFKYNFNTELKVYIEKLIKEYIEVNKIIFPQNTIITYIPITKKRFLWRGFNQAKEIANIFQQVTTIPILELIIKNKNTIPQKELKKQQRLNNLKNVFTAINIDCLDDITDIIIVDDIVTTGSTLKECIKTIERNINHKINFHIFVLAHGTK